MLCIMGVIEDHYDYFLQDVDDELLSKVIGKIIEKLSGERRINR